MPCLLGMFNVFSENASRHEPWFRQICYVDAAAHHPDLEALTWYVSFAPFSLTSPNSTVIIWHTTQNVGHENIFWWQQISLLSGSYSKLLISKSNWKTFRSECKCQEFILQLSLIFPLTLMSFSTFPDLWFSCDYFFWLITLK